MMLSDVCLTSVCLSVAYIGPKSRTERPRKTKFGTEVANVTRDSDITFKVKRSKVKVTGAGHIVAAPTQLVLNRKTTDRVIKLRPEVITKIQEQMNHQPMNQCLIKMP